MRKSLLILVSSIAALGLTLSSCSGSTDPSNSGAPTPTTSTVDADWCAGASQPFTDALQAFKDLDAGDASAAKQAISAFEAFTTTLPPDVPSAVPTAVSGLVTNLQSNAGPTKQSQADSETVVSYFEQQCPTAFLAAGSNVS